MKIEPELRQLFDSLPLDGDTMSRYRECYSRFSSDWTKAHESLGDFWRYADSLHAAGLLERRIEPIFKNGIESGCTIHYRRAA